MSSKDESSQTWVDLAEDGLEAAAERFDEDGVRYVGSELLGKGSMGRVLSVRDTYLGRRIAYKELRERLRGGGEVSPEMRARFVREARITARLEHPGIVSVHDIGQTAEGGLYYTMRFVNGRTFETALAEAPDLASRLALLPRLLDACQAIAFAHDRSVVHRDIKPANIVLGQYGETVVVDWGLAKELGEDALDLTANPASASGSFGASTSTSHGSVLGTPAYMSPEQASGQTADADERSDVWGLGAILFELLSGRRLVPDTDPAAAVERVRTGALPEVRQAAPRAPAELVAICERALAREPAERYADAGQLAHDLDAFSSGELVYAYAYSPAERFVRTVERYRAVVAVVLVAMLAVSGVTLASFQRVVAERDKARAAELQSQQQLADAHERSALDALGSGHLLEAEAFAVAALAVRDDRPTMRGVLASVHARRPPTLVERLAARCSELTMAGAIPICAGPAGVGPVGGDPWSEMRALVLASGPNGRVAALDDTVLRIFEDGALVREHALVPGTRPSTPLLLEDGSVILAEYQVVHRIDADGQEQWRAPAVASGVMAVAALSDTRMAMLTQSRGLYLHDLATGIELVNTSLANQGTYALATSPQALYVGSGNRTVFRLDPQLSQTHLAEVGAPVLALALSRDHAVLAVHTEDGTAWLFDAHDLQLLWHMRLPEEVADIAWDGRDLLVASGVHVTRWDTSALRPSVITLGEGLADLDWSPDGQRLAAGSGDGDVAVIDAETHQVLRRIHTDEGVVSAVSWAADGSLFAANVQHGIRRYSADGAASTDVFALDGVWVRHLEDAGPHGLYFASQDPHLRRWVEGAAQTLWSGPPPTPLWEIDTSPDDTHLAWTNNGHELRVATLPELDIVWEETFTGDGPRSLTLSPGGTLLARSTVDNDIELFELATRRRIAHFEADAFAIDNLEFSPDGRWLAAASWDEHVRIYDVDAQRLVADLHVHDHRVSDVEFSRDSTQLASGSWDYTVRFADLAVLDRSAADLASALTRERGVRVDGGELAWVEGGHKPPAE